MIETRMPEAMYRKSIPPHGTSQDFYIASSRSCVQSRACSSVRPVTAERHSVCKHCLGYLKWIREKGISKMGDGLDGAVEQAFLEVPCACTKPVLRTLDDFAVGCPSLNVANSHVKSAIFPTSSRL